MERVRERKSIYFLIEMIMNRLFNKLVWVRKKKSSNKKKETPTKTQPNTKRKFPVSQ